MYLRLTKHIFLHGSLLLFLLFSLFASAGVFFRKMLFFALLHEGFHFFTALFLGIPVLRLTVFPYGCHLRLGRTDFASEVRTALAGPLGSFFLYLLVPDPTAKSINLTLCLLNLLPALPLDGGKIMRLCLWKYIGVHKGDRILRFLGVLSAIVFLFHGLFYRSLYSLCIAALLFAELPDHSPPFLHKKAVRTTVRHKTVRDTDRLLLLSRLYSPFYSIRFHVSGAGITVSEEEVLFLLRRNAAATFGELIQRSSRLTYRHALGDMPRYRRKRSPK